MHLITILEQIVGGLADADVRLYPAQDDLLGVEFPQLSVEFPDAAGGK